MFASYDTRSGLAVAPDHTGCFAQSSQEILDLSIAEVVYLWLDVTQVTVPVTRIWLYGMSSMMGA